LFVVQIKLRNTEWTHLAIQ